jgi:formylglycine-generating enzyme required for sulfatase activity
VPPGPFIYGGAGGNTRVARLERGCLIGRAPVTNAQFARFVVETGCKPPRHWKGTAPSQKIADHPVVYVSWNDATAYAEWAGLRLPTDEEWEKAARGIDGRIYPWGETFDASRCNTSEGKAGTTTPVGRYSPDGDSPCGCADMAGNVWEWVSSEVGSMRVLRGGSWYGNRELARCAARFGGDPVSSSDYIGFRCVSPVRF